VETDGLSCARQELHPVLQLPSEEERPVINTRDKGTAIGLLIGALIILGFIALFIDWMRHSGTCTDTITLVSTIPGNPSTATCRHDQTMETENKMQGIVVRCVCRAEKP
jgi:hypothetical protein